MGMSEKFNCPSCTAPMVFSGGESIFQTCKTCHAPIIVPSEIYYPEDQQILSESFASLTNDVPVDPEQVTNELTPGDNLPRNEDIIDPDAKIEKFEIYQEKIGTSAVTDKKAFDQIVSPDDGKARDAENKRDFVFERIKSELRMGDKIEAIKIYRESFGKDLKEAKEIVEAIERKEFANR